MKLRLLLALCAMIATCIATGSRLDLFPMSSSAWNDASVAMTDAAAAFVGGVIARRRFMPAASLLALAAGVGLVVALSSIGGGLLTILRSPLLLASVGCALSGANPGAWTGQRLATGYATRAAAAHA